MIYNIFMHVKYINNINLHIKQTDVSHLHFRNNVVFIALHSVNSCNKSFDDFVFNIINLIDQQIKVMLLI